MEDNLLTWTNILIFAVIAATILFVPIILWRIRRHRRLMGGKMEQPRAPAPGLPVSRAVPADTETARRFVAYLKENRDPER